MTKLPETLDRKLCKASTAGIVYPASDRDVVDIATFVRKNTFCEMSTPVLPTTATPMS